MLNTDFLDKASETVSEQVINKEESTSSISTVENLESAKENLTKARANLESHTGSRGEKKYRKELIKAESAYKKELMKTPLSLPVEIWTVENKEGIEILRKEKQEVIIALSPLNYTVTKQNVKQAEELYTNKHFEQNEAKYFTSGEIFYKENIPLTDLNGNNIPKDTPVIVPIGSVQIQIIIATLYKLNINAMVQGKDLLPLTNVQMKDFESIAKCAEYMGVNTLLDRGMKSSEKAQLASFSTQHELLQKVNKVSKELQMPISTAMKYYTMGKKYTAKQWNESLQGNVPENITYDLTLGDKIIETLKEAGFEREFKSRYLIDAITGLTKSPVNKDKSIDAILDTIKNLTEEDVISIQGITDDKVYNISLLLQEKLPALT